MNIRARTARERGPGPAPPAYGAARRGSRWLAVLVVSALVAIHAYALVSVFVPADGHRLQGADVALAAPSIVAPVLAWEVNHLDGRPFDVHPVPSAGQAEADVRAGRVLGALLVDLQHTQDTLLVDGSLAPDVRSALVQQVQRIETGRGRTVRTEILPAQAPSARVRAASQVATAGGFLLGLLIGPIISLLGRCTRGVRRRGVAIGSAGMAMVAVVVLNGVAVLALLPDVSTRFLVLATLTGCSLVMMAIARTLDRLAGRVGVWLGLFIAVALTIPILRGLDVSLLPSPWGTVTQTVPTWSSYELVNAVSNHAGHGWLRPLMVLGAWLAAACIGLATWRRHPRAETTSSAGSPPTGWRGRSRATALLSIGLAAVLAVLVQLPQPSIGTVGAPDLTTETACIATGGVTNLQDLNRISAQVRGDGSFAGGDVGADVRLQDGRRLMVFGDTLRGPDFPEQQFVRNSMLVLAPDCIRTVLPTNGGAIIPDRLDPGPGGSTVGYWPMSIARVQRPGYDLVAVGAQRVAATGSGPFDFQTLGPAIAVFVVGVGKNPQLLTVRDLGADDADPNKPMWGAATAVHGDWVYIYGTATPHTAGVFGFSLRVARVHPDQILDQSRWRYWDGRTWQPEPRQAIELVPAVRGVSQTLSVFQQGDTWYALSKRDEFLGTDLVVWRADTPWGPFDDGTTVGRLPSDAAAGELRYMPLAHPDLLPKPGTMLVSYSRNRTDFGEIIANPFEYRPRFLRIELP